MLGHRDGCSELGAEVLFWCMGHFLCRGRAWCSIALGCGEGIGWPCRFPFWCKSRVKREGEGERERTAPKVQMREKEIETERERERTF